MMKSDAFRGLIGKLLVLISIGLLCWPTLAHLRRASEERKAAEAELAAAEALAQADAEAIEAARQYNDFLSEGPFPRALSAEEMEWYDSLMNVSGTGIMGRVSIPKIHLELPIYHNVLEDSLQEGAGHMPGTSLPVFCESSHIVIAGHRGLVNVAMFTELPQLEVGDTFSITALHQVLTYEVDQIRTVLPNEVDAIALEQGKQYCTLITCTPLGLNTHRLLVRGRLIEEESQAAPGTAPHQAAQGVHLATYEILLLSAAALLFLWEFLLPLATAIYGKVRTRGGDPKEDAPQAR